MAIREIFRHIFLKSNIDEKYYLDEVKEQIEEMKKHDKNIECKLSRIDKSVKDTQVNISFLVEQEKNKIEQESKLNESMLSKFCEALILFIVFFGLCFCIIGSSAYLNMDVGKNKFWVFVTLFLWAGNMVLGMYGVLKCFVNYFSGMFNKRNQPKTIISKFMVHLYTSIQNVEWINNSNFKIKVAIRTRFKKEFKASKPYIIAMAILEILFSIHFVGQLIFLVKIILIMGSNQDIVLNFFIGFLSYAIILILQEISNRTRDAGFAWNFNALTILIAIISLIISTESQWKNLVDLLLNVKK